MAEQDQNRNEAATPFKLREAQKRGQTAKSQEVTFVAILAAFVITFVSVGPSIVKKQLTVVHYTFARAGKLQWDLGTALETINDIALATVQIVAPLVLAILGAAILSNLAQVGVIFSAQPITPDLERLNPVNGMKRIFSLRTIYETLKSLLKLAALAYVLYLAIIDSLPDLLRLCHVKSHDVASLIGRDVANVLIKLLSALMILAAIDLIYTKWDFVQRMKMSKREVADEHKQREGDPRIRARLRQIRLEMLRKSRAVRNLPDADVVLTNPTHYAVALSYKHGEMPAPKLIAKGAGKLAQKIREAATRNKILVVENAPLARALYKRVSYEEYVPEDLYPTVAKILVWVYAERQRRASGAF